MSCLSLQNIQIWPLKSWFLLFSLPDSERKCHYFFQHKLKNLFFQYSQEEFYNQFHGSQNFPAISKYYHVFVIPLSPLSFTVEDKPILVKKSTYFKSWCHLSGYFYFTKEILLFSVQKILLTTFTLFFIKPYSQMEVSVLVPSRVMLHLLSLKFVISAFNYGEE